MGLNNAYAATPPRPGSGRPRSERFLISVVQFRSGLSTDLQEWLEAASRGREGAGCGSGLAGVGVGGSGSTGIFYPSGRRCQKPLYESSR